MGYRLAILIALFCAVDAMGQTAFEASADFDIEIVSAGDGVTFRWEVFEPVENVFTMPTATGNANASGLSPQVLLSVGSIIQLTSSASGSASGAFGLADSFAIAAGLLTVENTSALPQRFSIQPSWSLVADSSAFTPIFDSAIADSNVEILQDFIGVLFRQSTSTTFDGDGRVERADNPTFNFDLSAGTFTEFDFLVTSSGSAISASVPEPSGLLCIAILGSLAGLRRSRTNRGLYGVTTDVEG